MKIQYIEDPKGVITIEYSRIPYGKHVEMAMSKSEIMSASLIGIRLSQYKYYLVKSKHTLANKKVTKKEWDLLVNRIVNPVNPCKLSQMA